ncbi:MAG TPA: 50S ribosomal protein L18 [Candidatus Bathyarchaeia archaeon]|nr:50S ribosomal protein L18 [Candidatus Bathyarchaeia archaeon]
MAKSANYHVPFRRRREGKTNFHRRMRLLRSGEYRLIIRRSNKHVRVSVVGAKVIGDQTIADASSQHLKEYGWKAPTGNVPAAYLTGYLASKYAQAMNVKKAILDVGINSCRKDTRVAAMLCGAVQAGLKIPHDPEIFPSEERYTGQIIADYATKLKKDDSGSYDKQFSGYKKLTVKPESLPTYFKATLKAIDTEFTDGSMKTKLANRNKKNKIARPKTAVKKPTTTIKPKTTTTTKPTTIKSDAKPTAAPKTTPPKHVAPTTPVASSTEKKPAGTKPAPKTTEKKSTATTTKQPAAKKPATSSTTKTTSTKTTSDAKKTSTSTKSKK